MKLFFRIVYVIVAGYIAYKVFHGIYDEYYSYLPAYKVLMQLNESPGIANVLRDNSMGLRDLYNRALEKSILYALLSFVGTIVVLEYISFGNMITSIFLGRKNETKVKYEVKS